MGQRGKEKDGERKMWKGQNVKEKKKKKKEEKKKKKKKEKRSNSPSPLSPPALVLYAIGALHASGGDSVFVATPSWWEPQGNHK